MPLKLNRTLYTVNADLNTKASVESPALTGTPTAPTPSVGDNSTKLATTGFVAAAAGSLLRITTFTSSGTWTKQADVSRVMVQVVGGGGNGGIGIADGVGGSHYAGHGGGGGGYSMKLILSSSLNATETVTVGGATGTSSFGSHCSATGGSSGSNGTAGVLDNGGAGGSGIGGNLNLTGQRGFASYEAWENGTTSNTIQNYGKSGSGGSSPIFVGGAPWIPQGSNLNANVVGRAGTPNTGGGGSGGLGESANAAGGAGGSGIVIIYEYGY
jgi:hypothetical protein